MAHTDGLSLIRNDRHAGLLTNLRNHQNVVSVNKMNQLLVILLGVIVAVELVHASEEATNTTDVVISLKEINEMGFKEFLGAQLNRFWDYLVHGSKEEPESTFIGRCFGVGKKIKQMLPMLMFGGGVMMTKLAFLTLFSLKTMGLVGLLLLLNVGSIAAKLGAVLASKKEDQQPLHVHVQPWKNDEHVYSSHLKGPPYGWDDRSDSLDIQSHELYNLYEKLKYEQNVRKYLASNSRI